MNRNDILRRICSLQLPADQYIVVGGAALAVRGIRETEDIDLVVTPSLFEELERSGWDREIRPNGKPGLHHGNVEAYLDVDCGAFERTTDWLLKHSEEVEGLPLVDSETLAGFKRSYGRPKDLLDLELIDRYLRAKHPR